MDPVPPPAPPPAGPAARGEASGPESAALRERAANAMMDKERARYDAMASAAPTPKKPYTAKTVQTLVDTFNETLDKLGGQDLPNVEVDLKGEERWPEPLPASIFVPLVALFQAIEQVGGGKFAGKYTVAPDELVDDTGLRMAAGQLVRMGNDAALAKAMQEPIGGSEAPAPEGPAMTRGAMSPEDQEMMQSM
jgi:hypothetical protein